MSDDLYELKLINPCKCGESFNLKGSTHYKATDRHSIPAITSVFFVTDSFMNQHALGGSFLGH